MVVSVAQGPSLTVPIPCLRNGCFKARVQPSLRGEVQTRAAANRAGQHSKVCCQAKEDAHGPKGKIATAAVLGMLLAPALPALAEGGDFSQGGFAKESYYVTLGLFLLSLPGLWSQIKRAPKAKKVRKTFEVSGPAVSGAMPLDARARQIFQYFKKYNYEVEGTGDVIRFVGNYRASRGQAAALVFYVFCGLASTALVLSIALPFGGSNWYWLTALSPLSGAYYWQRGNRQEEFQVKMVTADDESVTDIMIEGAEEEAERMRKELNLAEKGKVYVRGLLEN